MSFVKTQKITFGGKELELRLDSKSIVKIENKIKKSLFMLFYTDGKNKMPTISEMFLVFEACSINEDVDMVDLLVNFIRDGNDREDFFRLFAKLIVDGKFFSKGADSDYFIETHLKGIREQTTVKLTI